MKKMLRVVGMLTVMLTVLLMVAGCFTSAGARTKKTIAPDGTVMFESDVKIIGTGDKTSQIAADGLFADGTAEDLGAGVKKASASQQSTGIGETLTGVARLLEAVERIKSVGAGEKAPAATDTSVESDTSTALTSTTLPAISEVTYSTDGYGGSPGPAGEGVYGRPSCGRCRAYHAAHPDTPIINLDDPANRTAFWAALRRLGFAGSTVALPVAVTAEGYSAGAK